MTKLYFFDSLQKLPGTPLGSFFFKMLFVSECENKIYHRRDVIHSLRRMIYLLRKYDIISVPSYALGVPSVQQGTDTIEKALAEASAFSGTGVHNGLNHKPRRTQIPQKSNVIAR